MTKTVQQIKNVVEDWLNNAKIPFVDTTEKQTTPGLSWVLEVVKIGLIMSENRIDRISMTTRFDFHPTHQQEIEQLEEKEWWNFVNDLNESCVYNGFGFNYKQEGQKLKLMEINTFVDTDTMTRGELFHKLDGLNIVKSHLMRKVQARFRTGNTLNPSTLTQSDTPAFIQ